MGVRQKTKPDAKSLALDGPEKFIVPELTVKDCLSVIPYVLGLYRAS